MRPRPRLSIVIPVKDDAPALTRCLEALGPQAEYIFEIIVVDNGSTDDSALVARRFGAVQLDESSPGIAAAASAGYDAASGDLIGRLDADSIPDQDWAKNVADYLATHPSVVAVTGGARFIDGPRALRGLGAAAYLGAYFVLVSGALGHIPLFGSNFAMTASAWRTVSRTVHRCDLLIHDDMDVSFHLGAIGAIRYGPRIRVGISSRPFTDGKGALRLRRGFHTIAMHWPHELPWSRVRRSVWRAIETTGRTRAKVKP